MNVRILEFLKVGRGKKNKKTTIKIEQTNKQQQQQQQIPASFEVTFAKFDLS